MEEKGINMGTLLGTPYERGKSDVIVSRLVAAPIAEGLFVTETDEKTAAAMSSGKTPRGVMGQNEIVGCSVVKAGLRVWVQMTDSETPTAGGQVYVDPTTGKATTTSAEMIAVNAVFASDEVRTDGITENTATKAYNVRCALINFVGGL